MLSLRPSCSPYANRTVKHRISVLTENWRISQVANTTVSCVVQRASMSSGILPLSFRQMGTNCHSALICESRHLLISYEIIPPGIHKLASRFITPDSVTNSYNLYRLSKKTARISPLWKPRLNARFLPELFHSPLYERQFVYLFRVRLDELRVLYPAIELLR